MKKIVFPEGGDERVLEAAAVLMRDGVCHPIVLGNVASIEAKLGDSTGYTAITAEDDVLAQGSSLVADGEAHGVVTGAVHTTADVFRAYRTTIGINEAVKRAASCFVMEKESKQLIFADCAINIHPDAQTLCSTAFLAAEFAQQINLVPKIAFLSFATGDSASDPSNDLVAEAVALTQAQYPDLIVSGPIQADVALVPKVASGKAPDGAIQGDANILIFPDLMSGNISYKLVERLGGYSATGPLLLGFKAPAHDLSRGCCADDIVKVATIAVAQDR